MNPGIYGAIGAAAHQQRMKQLQDQEEEERMTRYSPDELEGEWEFKIIRSYSPVFRKPEFLQRVLQEEAQAGWVMLEKLDDYRVRMKRPASAKRRDAMLPQGSDPYRTQIRGGSPATFLAMLGVTMVLSFGILAFVMLGRGGGFEFGAESFVLIGVFVLMLVVGVAVAVMRNRM